MSYQSKLKELEKIWYQKLKDEGFKDIEDTSRPERPLHSWHSLRFQKIGELKLEITTSYYDKAKELLFKYSFENETHRRIWELHCEGQSRRKIERSISHLEITYKHAAIGLIIKKIAKEIK